MNPSYQQTLTRWIVDTHQSRPFQNFQCDFKLLYKGSRDGYSALSFHLKCDDKYPTVTLIKSAGFN